MGLVDRICLPFAHIHRKGFAIVWHIWVVRSAIVLDEISKEWIWASGIVGGIRHRKDVLVRADRKAIYPAELWILEFLTQLLQKVFSTLLVVLEGHAKACDWFLVAGLWLLVGEKVAGCWFMVHGLYFWPRRSDFLR